MFGGFKASLNFFGKRSKRGVHSELSPDMTVSGAYRTSRDDSFGYRNSYDQSKKSTASEELLQQIRPTKSAADLTKVKNMPPHLRNSTVEVSRDPRGAPQEDPRNGAQIQVPKRTKNQEKEQKRREEKQRLAEQKAREKQAQEQAKQEKLRREKEKKEAQPVRPKRERRSDRKKTAPQPQPQVAIPVPPPPQQYSTNTLESSISRSSGPPPYSDVPTPTARQHTRKQDRTIKTQDTSTNAPSSSNKNENVTYSKPEDTGSWDLISQHRQQTIRPTTVIGSGSSKSKQMVMDLNYNFGEASGAKENSDA